VCEVVAEYVPERAARNGTGAVRSIVENRQFATRAAFDHKRQAVLSDTIGQVHANNVATLVTAHEKMG